MKTLIFHIVPIKPAGDFGGYLGKGIAVSGQTNTADLLGLTTEIVAAHLSKNSLSQTDLPVLITAVYDALSNLGKAEVKGATEVERPAPAVPVKKSITPDYLVCLEDGKKLKMLKRHLQTSYNMTPEQYRERWNLPSDYPMVAPNYAEHRSSLAKSIGLGTGRVGKSGRPVGRPPGKSKQAQAESGPAQVDLDDRSADHAQPQAPSDEHVAPEAQAGLEAVKPDGHSEG